MKIVLLGPDGAGKSSVIQGLLHNFEQAGYPVRMRHLKPQLVARGSAQPVAIVVDPQGKPPRSAFLSVAKILVWLFEEWYACLFLEPRKTLLICDRYYHDLLIDPLRYRFGAPRWTARLIGFFMPRPRLWILLHAPAEVLQARKQEVAPEETARQCQAYLDFIRTCSRHVIIDATLPLDRVIADVESAVRGLLPESKTHNA